MCGDQILVFGADFELVVVKVDAALGENALGVGQFARQGAAVHATGGYRGDFACVAITALDRRAGLLGRVGRRATGGKQNSKQSRKDEFFHGDSPVSEVDAI